MGSTPPLAQSGTALLPWEDGYDRATGGPSENPSAFADLRNIVWFPGAVRLRPGLGDPVATLADPVVCSVGVFQAYGLLVWVLFDPATLDVNVVSTNLQGQSETAIGTFGVLNASAQNPPRFTFAESYGILVVAHDEPNVALRFDTYRYDPASVGTEWDTIDADLDGMGAAPVQFRGVVTHLGAVWGWGYGSASDPDRPEVLRRSDPADPTVYVAEQYIQFGARLDPIIGCAPVSSSLAVFKGSSWYRLDGNTAATFSPQLVDPVIGLVSAQSVQNIQGVLYWWSPYGPRRTTGAATDDISLSLDLTGPLPTGLPVPGPGLYGFTYYVPDNQKLGFAFPDPDNPAEATVAYCVSLQGPLRWSLDVFNRTTLCAVLASTGQASILIDPGSADNVTVTGSVGGGPASATIGWTNEDCVGDETVEIWGSMNSGTWTLLTTVPVNLVTSPQTTVVSGGILASGTLDVAIRHRRLGRYLSTYVDPDPAMWPAASQGSGTIVAVATPSGVTVSYDFTTGAVTVGWTNGSGSQDLDVELARDGFAAPSLVQSVAAGNTSDVFTYGVGTPQDVAREAGLGLDPGSSNITARVRHKIGAVVGTWANAATPFSVTYNAAKDGAAVNRDTDEDRYSVALGSGTGFLMDRPTTQNGDMTVKIVVVHSTYGAIPSNSGCGVTQDFGGSFQSYPPSPEYEMYTATLPDSGPTQVATGFLPAPSCATCLGVGQLVGMGVAWAWLGWEKSGHVAPHGAEFQMALPGRVGGLVVCTV